MKISLICATIGRPQLLRMFLTSLTSQTYKAFEVIVVDQSANRESAAVVEEFASRLNLIHIRSPIGLSRARNAGLQVATGEAVGFPDDDCTYYSDTLDAVSRIFFDTKAQIILGRIYDRKLRKDVMRRWPKTERLLGYFGVYLFGSSICVFSRNTGLRMDERFGAGSVYGCCEDIDYCWRHLSKEFRNIPYFPSVEVLHPELNVNVMSIQKVRSYAFGAGGLYAKHAAYGVLVLSLMIHALRMLSGLLSFKYHRVRAACASIYMRLAGVWHYRKNVEARRRNY